jgi:hypothetical protein
MKTLIFLFILTLPLASLGQDLYIKIDVNDTQYQQYAGNWVSPDNDGKYLKSFIFCSTCRLPDFVCSDKATRSQMLPLSALSNYTSLNLKTVAQIEAVLMNKREHEMQDWILQFQNIYIIQVLPATNQIEVSKVDKPRFIEDR